MCKYITQGKADGNSCGAFTLAYYEWEISGHAKAEAADRAYISALYNDIVFGCAMPGFESYSNPMLMMRRLAKQGAKPVFHLGENPLIRQMFGVLSAAAKQEVAQMKMLGMLCEAALDVEQAAEYAILVCQMLENGAPVNKLHYVLMKKSCDREPLILNPWHSEALPPAQPLTPGASVEPSLVWTGAAIEILLPG